MERERDFEHCSDGLSHYLWVFNHPNGGRGFRNHPQYHKFFTFNAWGIGWNRRPQSHSIPWIHEPQSWTDCGIYTQIQQELRRLNHFYFHICSMFSYKCGAASKSTLTSPQMSFHCFLLWNLEHFTLKWKPFGHNLLLWIVLMPISEFLRMVLVTPSQRFKCQVYTFHMVTWIQVCRG